MSADPMHNAGKLTTLPLVEHVLLWSMRAWVVGRCRDMDVAGRIGTVFAQLQAVEATECLYAFMQALSRGMVRNLDINCVCYPDVTADEADLLDVFALQQENHGAEAVLLLERMVVRQAAKDAARSASRLVLCLNAAGRVLPRASDALRRHAFVQHTAIYAAPTSFGLH